MLIDPESAVVLRVIVLQYNPDTLTRTLQVKGVPPERIKELQEELDREDYALFRPDRAMAPRPRDVL